MHCGFCDIGFAPSADRAWSDNASPTDGLLRIPHCLVFVDCAAALGNTIVNRRRIRLEENYLIIPQVRKTDQKATWGTSIRIRRNCQPISTQTVQFNQRDIVTEIINLEVYHPRCVESIIQCIMCVYLHIHAVKNTKNNIWYHYVIWSFYKAETCLCILHCNTYYIVIQSVICCVFDCMYM